MNRKGIFFTIFAMILISLFVISLVVVSDFSKRESTRDRVETLDNLFKAFEENIPERIYLIGFRTIFLAEQKIINEGEYISSLDSLVEETFFNGTFEGTEYDAILEGTSFNYTIEFLREKAAKISANVSIYNPSVSVFQDEPWNVKINFSCQLVLEDLADTANWNRTMDFIVEIPTSNFNDPIYLINTNGLMTQKVVRTPITDFVDGSDVSNLKSHLNGSYYFASTSAPSFIDRLEGRNSPSAYGVESLVNLQKFESLGFVPQQKSVVDYIYFSADNPVSCNVLPTGMQSWFRLDAAHLATYEVACA